MLTLANGTYFPVFLIYFAFGLVIRLLPVTFVTFHRQNPALSFPVLNFNLPFELDEVCAQLFADGLNQLSRGDLYRLCAALGV